VNVRFFKIKLNWIEWNVIELKHRYPGWSIDRRTVDQCCWSDGTMRRALHFVFKVGDRAQTATFYRDVLGMQVGLLSPLTRLTLLKHVYVAAHCDTVGTWHVVLLLLHHGIVTLNYWSEWVNVSLHHSRFYAMKSLKKAAKHRAMGRVPW